MMKHERSFQPVSSARALVVVLTMLLLLCLSAGICTAQDTFVTPERYPQDRYETGWMKNPFTLKTAPVAAEKKSFAKDLVLHNIVRVGDEVTAVLANAKTKEFYRVKNNEPAANGMKIRIYAIKDLRKDSYVEVELNGEIAVVRPDDNFRKQMLAGNSARGTRGKGGAGAGAGAAGEGADKDGTDQPVMTPGNTNPTSPAPDKAGGMPGAGAHNNTHLKPPVERPELPRRPSPTPPMPQDPALAQTGGEQPISIRPNGSALSAMPPRGSAPSTPGRRFFTSPVNNRPSGGAPASATP